jgi:hypothetical protein
MTGPYLNDPGYEVPDNTILIVPHAVDHDGFYTEVIKPLKGNPKRDWFNSHFYYCLPLTIANQYGFVIESLRDFEVVWSGGDKDVEITFLNDDNNNKQVIKNGFGSGIITVQNMFSLKTPPGINVMTIQPPNMFITGCASMAGVIETDQIKRDFTFNIKVTVPNLKITVKKGDPLGAFIPIQRYFVDKFDVKLVSDIFDRELHVNEVEESNNLGKERLKEDQQKPHSAGRRYFRGINFDGTKYADHQKKVGTYNEQDN